MSEKEFALKFLEELEDSGELNNEAMKIVQDLQIKLSKEKVSVELENEIFKMIESLKEKYFFYGVLAGKNM